MSAPTKQRAQDRNRENYTRHKSRAHICNGMAANHSRAFGALADRVYGARYVHRRGMVCFSN